MYDCYDPIRTKLKTTYPQPAQVMLRYFRHTIVQKLSNKLDSMPLCKDKWFYGAL